MKRLDARTAMLSLLVTVGSTQFPLLTDYISNPTTLSSLLDIGITRITIQHGTHPIPQTKIPHPLTLHPIPYTTHFPRLLSEADLIVSHAGSGTVLEAIQHNKPLVVIVNSSLMDNHQTELAHAMARRGCCQVLHDSHLSNLISAIQSVLHRSSHGTPPVRRKQIFGVLVAQELTHAHASSANPLTNSYNA